MWTRWILARGIEDNKRVITRRIPEFRWGASSIIVETRRCATKSTFFSKKKYQRVITRIKIENGRNLIIKSYTIGILVILMLIWRILVWKIIIVNTRIWVRIKSNRGISWRRVQIRREIEHRIILVLVNC